MAFALGIVMTHAELISAITDAADDRGLLWHQCPDSRRCRGPRGFPDLVIAGPQAVLFTEVKVGDQPSPDQTRWAMMLRQSGGWGLYVVWEPADWAAGAIQSYLSWLAF